MGLIGGSCETGELHPYQAHPGGTAEWGEARLGVERTEQDPPGSSQQEEVLGGGVPALSSPQTFRRGSCPLGCSTGSRLLVLGAV